MIHSQFASIADFVYGHAPHRVFTLEAVGRPLILSIKTIRTNITHQHPQERIFKAQCDKPFASCRYKSLPHAMIPVIRIDIQRVQFGIARQIRVSRWRSGGKPANQSRFSRYDGVRALRIAGCEVISLRPVFGAKFVELLVWKETPIGRLP